MSEESKLVREVEIGEINVEMRDNKIKSKTYTGKDDLIVIVKDTRSAIDKMPRDVVAMHMIAGLSIGMLVGTSLMNFGFDIIGVIILAVTALYGLGGVAKIFSESENQSKDLIKIESKGRGRVVELPESSINAIVKLESGKVRRVYQLIDDKKILEGLSVSNTKLLESEIPIALVGDRVLEVQDEESNIEDLTTEQKAIFNIGKTIPELNTEDTQSVLNSLEQVYEYKIEVEKETEYNRIYQSLLESNKHLGKEYPTLLESQKYLNNELNNISTKINTEMIKNDELVKEVIKTKDVG